MKNKELYSKTEIDELIRNKSIYNLIYETCKINNPYLYIHIRRVNNFFSLYGLQIIINNKSLKVINSFKKEYKKFIGKRIVAVNGKSIYLFFREKNLNNYKKIYIRLDDKREFIIRMSKEKKIKCYEIDDLMYLNCVNFAVPIPHFINQRKIILDFCNNAGGSIKEACEIIDLFCERGFIKCKNSNNYIIPFFFINSRNEKISKNKKIYILINENTMSSAEIVAYVLKKYVNAKLIGKSTFGKNIIQEQISLNSNIKIVYPKYKVLYDFEQNKIMPDIYYDLENMSPKSIINKLKGGIICD